MHPNDIKHSVGAALAVAAIATLGPSLAMAEQHIVCPSSVDVRQVRVDSPEGWTGIYGPEGRLPLRGVQAIFVVHSLRDAWGELKDPPTERKGEAVITKYPLPPEEAKYVICEYGERVYQAMKLPDTTKECDVIYRPEKKGAKGKKANYVLADIVCK